MGYIFTLLQFVGLGLIIFTPPLVPQAVAGQLALVLALALGFWAIFAFRDTKINVFPYLRNGAMLVRKGPYKHLRHPMYTAVLLFALAYFIDNPTWIYAAFFIGILIVLIFKMNYEEKQLARYFKDYEAEFFSTYRIIPCVY